MRARSGLLVVVLLGCAGSAPAQSDAEQATTSSQTTVESSRPTPSPPSGDVTADEPVSTSVPPATRSPQADNDDDAHGYDGGDPTGDVALTLSTITYLADVTIEAISDAPDLPGSHVIDVTVDAITWRARDHWDMGERVEPEFPPIGERIQLVIDDDWRLVERQHVALGVTSRTRPMPSSSGYARFVLLGDDFAEPEPSGGGFAKAIVAVVRAAHARSAESSVVDTLELVLAEANDWTTRINRDGPSEPLRGLLADG